ncbi:MAG: MazG nucleotide pyrophosphohydrolase domain-containing protein, partial [Gemmiger sp.]
MTEYPQKERYTAEDLCRIIAILRDPEKGCPWDKVQTHASIRMNFLEETYEAVDALDLDDPKLLCEELGDVLMQVAFHAQIETERGNFTWSEVCDGVCRKLIWRHPAIFGPAPGTEGIKDWDLLKNKEKGRKTLADDLDSVPKALPALMRAAK